MIAQKPRRDRTCSILPRDTYLIHLLREFQRSVGQSPLYHAHLYRLINLDAQKQVTWWQLLQSQLPLEFESALLSSKVIDHRIIRLSGLIDIGSAEHEEHFPGEEICVNIISGTVWNNPFHFTNHHDV